MYSNMCVKLAVCLALIVSIDGYVLKHRTLPLSPEGMTVEVTVRSKDDPRHVLSTMKIDINEKDKKVEMSMAEALPGVPRRHLTQVKRPVDRNKKDKTMEMSMAEALSGVPRRHFKSHNLPVDRSVVPILGSRAGMVVGTCPAGYTPRGRFCVPDDY